MVSWLSSGKGPYRWKPARLLPFLLVLSSCASESQGFGFETRDSAGVRILETTENDDGTKLNWSVDPVPSLIIGKGEAPDQQIFRVQGALRLDTGLIVVANAGSHELLVFDGGGRRLRAFSREGEGPGEVRSMSAVFEPGSDSLLVFDSRLRRTTIFDPEGNLLGHLTFDSGGGTTQSLGFYTLGGVLREGSFVFIPQAFQGELQPGAQISWMAVPNLLYDEKGAFLGTLGEPSGMDWYSTAEFTAVAYFGRTSSSVVAGEEFFITAGGEYEVRAYSGDGRLTRIFRLNRNPREITASDESALEAYELGRARTDEARTRAEARLRDYLRPDFKPWISGPWGLRVDPSGRLWVEEYKPRWDDSHRRWGVFEANGRWLGSVEFPQGVRVFQIGEDFVLGLWHDPMDVEQVRLYALDKHGGGS